MIGRVLRDGVVAVAGRDEGQLGLTRKLDEQFVRLLDVRKAVLLQLQVVVVEDLAAPARQGERFVVAAVQQVAMHFARVAARQRDDARSVLFEQLPVHAGLVVVALQVGLGDELQQVAIAPLVSRQQGEVVRRLVLHVARAPVSGRDVGLDADDGLDAAGARLSIEIDDAVEGAVVGDGAGLLAQLLYAIEQLGYPREAVEEAVFGMKV